MDELEKLSKAGWRFAVWLIPGGVCIIQGKHPDEDGDWDFDEGAASFSEALSKALFHVSKQQADNDPPPDAASVQARFG